MTASVAEYMPVLRVALDLPLHRLFDYVAESATPADVGLRVRVPFGRGERLGVIVEVLPTATGRSTSSSRPRRSCAICRR